MLIDSVFVQLGRSCNLIWFSFKKNHIEYVIHFQCFLRLLSDDKVITTSDEIYTPYNDTEQDFNWEKFGTSLYDHLVAERLNGGMKINDVKVGEFGDLNLQFSDGMILQALNNSSQMQEIWRIIKSCDADKIHIVYPFQLSDL